MAPTARLERATPGLAFAVLYPVELRGVTTVGQPSDENRMAGPCWFGLASCSSTTYLSIAVVRPTAAILGCNRSKIASVFQRPCRWLKTLRCPDKAD
jgi:hypothetical protein